VCICMLWDSQLFGICMISLNLRYLYQSHDQRSVCALPQHTPMMVLRQLNQQENIHLKQSNLDEPSPVHKILQAFCRLHIGTGSDIRRQEAKPSSYHLRNSNSFSNGQGLTPTKAYASVKQRNFHRPWAGHLTHFVLFVVA
jgi:hypothetical protein